MAVFFDFDNTITKTDVIDDMLLKFSADDKWMKLEEEWKKGRIGSRRCLDGQMRGLRITKRDLDGYLAKIELDPYFKRLLKLLRSKRAEVFILSDNFDYILKSVLKRRGVRNVKVYCNAITLRGDRLIPRFPFTNERCDYCGHCKKDTIVKNRGRGHPSVYVGDGMSDFYPARHADIVFAKDSLLKYHKEHGLPCVPIKGLKDVYDYLKKI